jgi:molecular chaperone DnaK (HSP70)
VPIIAKNTAIPVRKSEVFFTVADNQTSVEVRIFQGENNDAMRNIQLGEFRVEGLSKAPAGNPIIIDLALDRDGILDVSAKEKCTGLERRITIDRAMSRYNEDELRDARQRIAELFDTEDAVDSEDALDTDDADAPRSQVDREAAVAGDADVAELIAKARATLDAAVDEDRAELKALIEMIKDCEERGDATGRKEASAQIRDLLFYLEA